MTDMTDFVVGPGVAAAIEAAGDEARSDEHYFLPDISETVGRDALYYYIKADNVTRRLPFE